MPVNVAATADGTTLACVSRPDNIGGYFSAPSTYVFYTEDDLYSASIPAALGTSILAAPVAVPSGFFGTHRQVGKTAGGLNYAFERNHDAGTGTMWFQIHTAAGVYDWTALDKWVDECAGREIVFTIFGTPTWASARPTETSPYGVLGIAAEPTNMATLADFTTALVTRYLGRINTLEVWNEPKYIVGSSSYFSGTPAKLAEIARTIYTAAKAVDPAITIIGVGATGLAKDFAPTVGDVWTNDFLAAADGATGTGKDWIDALSVHAYIHDNFNTLENLLHLADTVNEIKSTNSLAMDVWVTEFGFITPTFNAYEPQEAKANMMARYILYMIAAGYTRLIHYSYGGPIGWGGAADTDTAINAFTAAIAGKTVTVVNKLTDGSLACVADGQRLRV